MNKQKFILAGLAIAVLGVAGLVYVTVSKGPSPQSSNNTSELQPDPPVETLPEEKNQTKPSEKVTKTGMFGCLKPKQTDGPQTLECAFGLIEADGTQYGLRSDDPAALGSTSQQQVEVTGVLTSPQDNIKYDIAGTIAVESIKPL